MRFSVLKPDTQTDLWIIGIDESLSLTTGAEHLKAETRKAVQESVKSLGFRAQFGQTLLIQGDQAVLLIGTDNKPLRATQFRKLIDTVVKHLKTSSLEHIAFTLHDLDIEGASEEDKLALAINSLQQCSYDCDAMKTKKVPALAQTISFTSQYPSASLAQWIDTQNIIAEAQRYCRDLGNLPPNVCTPTYLLNEAKKLQKVHSHISLEDINDEQAEKLGMGAFCSVSQGSKEEGHIVILSYQGAKDAKAAPIALVGKGITFDTGGNVIKPPAVMSWMKFDMCGAATVLSIMKACAELKLPINLVCVMTCAENMVSDKATRPGDIVTSLSGQTIEIINTDAEGRLVLCDAMTYVQRKYKPHTLIDVATLTGAIIATFANVHTGFCSNDDTLSESLMASSRKSFDPAWRLPLDPAYDDLLKSQFADTINGNFAAKAGSIVAATYLHKFIEDGVKWIHMDIAGSSLTPSGDPQASGRPMHLLMTFLMEMSQKYVAN